MKFKNSKIKLIGIANEVGASEKLKEKIIDAKSSSELKKIRKSLNKQQKEVNKAKEINSKMTKYVSEAPKNKKNVRITREEQIKFANDQNRVNKLIPESEKEKRTFFTPVTKQQLIKGNIALEYQEAGEYDRTRNLLKIPKKYTLREGTTLDAVKKLANYNRPSNKDLSHLATSVREARKTGVNGFDRLFDQGGVDLIKEFSRNGFTILEWADSLREANVPNYKEVIAEKVKSVYSKLQNKENIALVGDFLTNLGIKLPKHPLE